MPDGIFLKEPIPDATPPWAPFPDRLAFDWAQYHYVHLQSSADEILKGLDIWCATVIKHESKCRETDHTLDSVKAGDINWKTFKFCYSGPKPHMPPRWMEETYDLNAEMSTIMQGIVFFQILCQDTGPMRSDASTYGAMLVPVVAGSDKTTVSVATGHQENAVLPIAFLPIPKMSKHQQKKVEFQKFCHQLYHLCLEFVFSPLKPYMEKPKIIRCPNRHFCHAIFSLGPYIADYPERVWLAGNFDPEILWDDFRIWHDIVPFMHAFPQADIHELLAPDLLHQLIKGTFKDHLVAWVFLAAIAGYIPSAMVQSITSFMDACYIACRNAITAPALEHFRKSVEKFHELWNIFIEAGVWDSISLPCQHALKHFYNSIHLFGSPNGLCLSITESKHIKVMLQIIVRMEKMTVLRRIFSDCGMLIGTTSSYMAGIMTTQEDQEATVSSNEEDEEEDGGVIPGDPSSALFVTNLAARFYLKKLAAHISQPKFPLAFYQFLSMLNHPDQLPPLAIDCCPQFEGDIKVHHSPLPPFMLLPDADTEMWTVQLECDQKGESTAQVIPLETITRAAHLLPIYGSTRWKLEYNFPFC
ncbi:hypothetical protein BJV74DRAFT_879459 [Russula compacta]|nr:hypothetical protein BJV74DRAFT_879459 [Russula compacta]